MSSTRVWPLGLVVLATVGCSTITSEEFLALQAKQRAYLEEARRNYRIQPGDTLLVIVYRGAEIAPQYRQEVTVRPDGNVSLINISRQVPAEGRTVEQFRESIKELYQPIIGADPDGAGSRFEVTVQFMTNQKTMWFPDQVFVTGQVRRSSAVPYKEGLTIMQAIAEAQGWIYAANESKTVILRLNEEGKTVAHEIDLAAVALNEQDDILLRPGDVVFVPLSLIARINLWVEYYIRGLIPINPSILRTFVAL